MNKSNPITTTTTLVSAMLIISIAFYSQQQEAAYGQQSPINVTFDEVDKNDEDYQELISTIISILENQTATYVNIWLGDEGSFLNYTEIVFESGSEDIDDVRISLPNNYTLARGYEYRDDTIYKPDGTELFAD